MTGEVVPIRKPESAAVKRRRAKWASAEHVEHGYWEQRGPAVHCSCGALLYIGSLR